MLVLIFPVERRTYEMQVRKNCKEYKEHFISEVSELRHDTVLELIFTNGFKTFVIWNIIKSKQAISPLCNAVH